MAIQAIKGGLWIPRPIFNLPPSVTLGNLLIDASAEKVAVIFRAPKTGTLDKFEFRVGTVAVAAGSQIRCSFQDVSVTNGDPDGTQDQFRNIAGSSFASNTWMVPGLITSDGTDTGTKRSVTQGDLIAAVIEYSTFTAADSINITVVNNSVGGAGLFGQGYNDLFTTVWAKQEGSLPNIALKYDDGTYEFIGDAYAISAVSGATNINSTSSPDEVGNIFQFPNPVRVGGAWFLYNPVAAGRNWRFKLYDSDGSTALENILIDADQVSNTGVSRYYFARFTANRDLLANTNYRMTLVPDTTNNNQYQDFTVSAAAIMDAFEGGQNVHKTERTDAGAWTQTTTRRVWMGLLLVGL